MTGMIHFGAREYDPILARWGQQDSQGFVNGPSLYQTDMDDPARFVDPSGCSVAIVQRGGTPVPLPNNGVIPGLGKVEVWSGANYRLPNGTRDASDRPGMFLQLTGDKCDCHWIQFLTYSEADQNGKPLPYHYRIKGNYWGQDGRMMVDQEPGQMPWYEAGPNGTGYSGPSGTAMFDAPDTPKPLVGAASASATYDDYLICRDPSSGKYTAKYHVHWEKFPNGTYGGFFGAPAAWTWGNDKTLPGPYPDQNGKPSPTPKDFPNPTYSPNN